MLYRCFSTITVVTALTVVTVTDGVEGVCLDPGETGAILEAGVVWGPGPPGGGKGRQLASDSGGG